MNVRPSLAGWRAVDDPALVAHARSGAHALALVNDRWERDRGPVPSTLNESLRFAIEEEWLEAWSARPRRRGDAALEELADIFTNDFDELRERRTLSRLLKAFADHPAPLRAAARRAVYGWGGPVVVVGRLSSRAKAGEPAPILVTAAGLPFPLSWYGQNTLRSEYVDHMSFLAEAVAVDSTTADLADGAATAGYDLDAAMARARIATTDDSGTVPVGGRLGEELAAALCGPVVARPADAAALESWASSDPRAQEAWLITRALYELAPFVSENALVRNSAFFAGRLLGRDVARSRSGRLVSYLKTVVPTNVDAFYRARSSNTAKLPTARELAGHVARAAQHDPVVLKLTDAKTQERLKSVRIHFGDEQRAEPMNHRGTPSASSVISSVIDAAARRTAWVLEHGAVASDSRTFSTSVSYRNSTNSIWFPLAMLSYPMLGSAEADLGDYAYFGGIAGHEMAHAIVPRDPAEIRRWCDVLGVDRAIAAEDAAADSSYVERRELLCDALGFRWALQAARTDLSGGGVTRLQTLRFLSLWTTRFRDSDRSDGRGSLEVGLHPSPSLRCGVARVVAMTIESEGHHAETDDSGC